jgi:transposase InsO family protein
MPWKIITVIRARQRLVESMLARRKSYRELFRDFGVSRATAYKWFARFHAQGMTGLHNHSRRPRRSPRTLASQWVRKIDQWRRRRPHWGAKKIHRQLRRESPGFRLPCVRTIQRWLHRLGHVQPRKRRARKGPLVPHPGLTHPTKTNQVWTVDFKGWFCTGDGVRQEPLTVRDLFSRYGLCLQLLPNQDDQGVRRTMQRLFRRSGLPEAIRVDNGSPFSGTGALGLSRLSVWWLRLGIRVEFTRRARLGDNAAHEQFHGCYQREVVDDGAADRQTMQRRSHRWLRAYNQERPHESLNQRTPAEIYQASPRTYPTSLAFFKYPSSAQPRRVRNRGHIKWKGRLRFIGRAFVGQTVGLIPLENEVYAVHLGKLLLGHLHGQDPGGIRPARWNRKTDILKV